MTLSTLSQRFFRVTMASTPKPRSCISALTNVSELKIFRTYDIHFVISCILVWYVLVYYLYGRIRNLNRRNMCEYMQYMCEFEYRIKNNTNTPHHYWDDLSHLSCCPPKCTPPVRLFWQSVATWAKGGSWPSWMVVVWYFFRTFLFFF